jgi:hypothetical protein
MELLNGKAKELFKKWLDKQVDFRLNRYTKEVVYMGAIGFESLSQTMKSALIIEWLDSVGYNIHTDNLYYSFYFKIRAEGFEEIITFGKSFKSRQEATTEAIKKAVELINESNGK